MPRPHKHPKSRVPHFRLVVPEDLREEIGKVEIRKSLGTTDTTEAKIRHAELLAEWKARFRDLRLGRERQELDRAPQVVEEFLQQMAARRFGDLDGAIHGIQKFIVYRLFTAWGPYEYKDRGADLALRHMPADDAWVDWEEDSLADVIPEEERDTLIARIQLLHRHPHALGLGFRDTIRFVKSARRWDAVGFEILMIAEFTGTRIDCPSPFYDAIAENLVDRLIGYRSHRWDLDLIEKLGLSPVAGSAEPVTGEERTPLSSSTAILPPTAVATNAGDRADRSQTLSVALEKWKTRRTPGASAYAEATRSVARFVNLYGDKQIASITANDLFDYVDFLEDMPAGLQLPAILAAGQNLRDAVREAKEREAVAEKEARTAGRTPPAPRRLSPTSVKKDVGTLSAILETAKAERWILANPAKAIPVSGYSKKGRKVLPLRPDMMIKLFDSPLFTGCKGKSDIARTQPGPLLFQDALYWSFLFGATSGNRLEELGQVLLEDIAHVEGPDGRIIAGIFVTGTGLDQSVKNDASMRVIVVHPRLIELGFLDYVETRRAAGKERLFDLKKSKLGKWTQKLSQQVNRYIDRVVIDDRRFVFHSLRHEFADRSEITIPLEVSKKIMGHARGRLYGLGAPLHHAAKELESLDLDFIDWGRLLAAAGRPAVSGQYDPL